MADDFAALVSAWVNKSKERAEAVFRQSAQELIEIAQEPVSAGGNMPVKTGFLRASGLSSIGEPTAAVTYNPEPETGRFGYNAAKATMTIAGATINDTIYFTWTANYAPYVEARRGFVRLAAQQWSQVVDRVALRAATEAGR